LGARWGASAWSWDVGSSPGAEAAALEPVRLQASLARADAVIEIERRVYDTGAWITYDEDVWGGRYRHDRWHDDRRDEWSFGPEIRSGTARERRDLEVTFRGMAVRWVEGVR